MSTILTTVAEKSFSGPMFSEITDAFPGQPLLDRTSMNTWEDAAVIEEVNRIGKERIIFAGLWTSVCIVGPVASAIDQGFDVYFIADACGDIREEAHERAVQRMIQRGANQADGVLVAIVTHAGEERCVRETLERLAGSDSLLDTPMVMHILD